MSLITIIAFELIVNEAITSEVKNVDKYEYKVRSEEISKLINEEKYAEAVKIADTIDWRRVKSSTMLLKISALYRVNRRNEDSRDILLLAYDRYPTNRSVVYSLCELSIELDDVVAAIEFYKQFVKIAPDDSGVYTLRYRILEAQEASLEERIAILEELKAKDYQEEWVYELAYLYHRIGLGTKCAEICDELILWIGDGPYVVKAMELKALHVPLTEEQQAKYNFMVQNAKGNYSAAGYGQEDEQGYYDEEGNYIGEGYDANYDENGNYIGEGYDANYDENGNYIGEGYDANYDENGNYIGEGYDANYDENGNYIGENYDENGNYIGEDYGDNYNEGYNEGYDANYDENGNYIGDNYDENGNYIGDEYYADDNYSEGNYSDEEFYQENTYDEYGNPIEQQQQSYNYNDVDMSQYNTINLQKVVAESMKELFPDDDVFAEERDKLNSEEPIEDNFENSAADEVDSTRIYNKFEEDTEDTADTSEAPLTGQMKIDDVLAEWERMKENNAKLHQEQIRNQILSQTGQMMADFDTSVNNDIMAKLDDSKKVSVKGGSIVIKPEAQPDDLEVQELDEIEELEEIQDTDTEPEDMTELEKAVANELGGTTQNIPYETVEAIADADTAMTDEDIEEDYYEEIQYAETKMEAPDYEMEAQAPNDEIQDIDTYDNDNSEYYQEDASDELDADEEEDIALMAKEDALRTQEIKMNTADLSVLSEKIVETTNKEATGAKREEIREFTDDEQILFENFAVTKKIKKQIINALENMSLAAYTGNVIITGEAGLDTMRMAKNLIKEYQTQDPNFSGKIAKITGDKINERDLREIFDKLDNGGIIIEKANGMSEEKLYEMASLLNQENIGIIVILEDTKKEISKLLEKQAMIADYFNLRIDLMEMDNNALVAYAKNYALALEYAIDELGTLALYTRIANMQSGNHVVTKDEVRDIIDEAIYKSKKSKIKNFVDVLFSRRYDNEDMIVLKERDFI
jgi:hypothetical protein